MPVLCAAEATGLSPALLSRQRFHTRAAGCHTRVSCRKDRIAHTVGQLLTSGLAVCFEYLESTLYSSHVILAQDPLALPVPVHDITSEHGILEPLLSHPRAPSQGPLCTRVLCHFSPRSTRQGAASGSPCCCTAAGLQGQASRHADFRNAQPGSGSPPSPCPALSVSFLSIHLAL